MIGCRLGSKRWMWLCLRTSLVETLTGGEIVSGEFLDSRRRSRASVTTFRLPFQSGSERTPVGRIFHNASEMVVIEPFPIVEYQPWQQREGSGAKSTSSYTIDGMVNEVVIKFKGFDIRNGAEVRFGNHVKVCHLEVVVGTCPGTYF